MAAIGRPDQDTQFQVINFVETQAQQTFRCHSTPSIVNVTATSGLLVFVLMLPFSEGRWWESQYYSPRFLPIKCRSAPHLSFVSPLTPLPSIRRLSVADDGMTRRACDTCPLTWKPKGQTINLYNPYCDATISGQNWKERFT